MMNEVDVFRCSDQMEMEAGWSRLGIDKRDNFTIHELIVERKPIEHSIKVGFSFFAGRSEPKGVGDPCAGCNKPILDKFLLNVLERGWHASCVRCCECHTPLTDKCFSREAKLYCRNDFFR